MQRFALMLLLLGLALLAPGAPANELGPAPSDVPAATASSTRPSPAADLGRLPLGGQARRASDQDGATPSGSPADTGVVSDSKGMIRTLGALAGVLTLILSLAWAYRKIAAKSGGLAAAVGAGGRAPAGLVEVLARYPVAGRQTLVVLRFDRRVLLCCMSHGGRGVPAGVATLCELNDPEDVASVLIKTRDEAGDSIARSFERSLRDADAYAGQAARERSVTAGEPGVAGASQGPFARGLEALWRGRGG